MKLNLKQYTMYMNILKINNSSRKMDIYDEIYYHLWAVKPVHVKEFNLTGDDNEKI